MAGGGGIRWDWNPSGSITLLSRFSGSGGDATTGTPSNLTTMSWRNLTTLGTDVTIAQFSTSGVQRGSETLIVNGSGTVTFRFAQETSNAAATDLDAGVSYALITRLAS